MKAIDNRFAILNETIDESKRLINKCMKAKRELKDNKYALYKSVHFASAKRQSMELTRVLSRLRSNKSYE